MSKAKAKWEQRKKETGYSYQDYTNAARENWESRPATAAMRKENNEAAAGRIRALTKRTNKTTSSSTSTPTITIGDEEYEQYIEMLKRNNPAYYAAVTNLDNTEKILNGEWKGDIAPVKSPYASRFELHDTQKPTGRAAGMKAFTEPKSGVKTDEEVRKENNEAAAAVRKSQEADTGGTTFGEGQEKKTEDMSWRERLKADAANAADITYGTYSPGNATGRTKVENTVASGVQDTGSSFWETLGFLTDQTKDSEPTEADKTFGYVHPDGTVSEPVETLPFMEKFWDWLSGKSYEKSDTLAKEAQESRTMAKEGAGKVGSLLVDAGSAATQMAGDAILGTLTGSGLAPLGIRAFGGGAREAREAGASRQDQFNYGASVGIVEVLTEKIGSVALPFKTVYGAGAVDNIIENLVKQSAKTPLGRAGLSTLFSAVLEGGEEVLSDVLNPILKMMTYNPEGYKDYGKPEYWSNMLRDGIIGAGLGAVGGGGQVVSAVGQSRAEGKAYGADPQALIDSGLETTEGSKAHELAQEMQQKLDDGDKISGKEYKKLAKAIDAEYAAEQGQPEASTAETSAQSVPFIPYSNTARSNAAQNIASQGSRSFSSIVNDLGDRTAIARTAEKNNVSAEVVERVYNLNPDADVKAFNAAFDAAVQMGQQNANTDALSNVPVLTAQQAKIAYTIGQSKAQTIQKTNNSAVDSAVSKAQSGTISLSDVRPILADKTALTALQRLTGKIDLKGKSSAEQRESVRNAIIKYVEDRSDGVHIRDGGERLNGEDTEGQVSGVEAGAGKDKGGRAETGRGSSTAAQGKAGERVVYNGVTQKNAYYHTGEETEDMKKSRRLAESYGYKVTFFEGGNIRVEGGSVRGVVDTNSKTVMVRTDHSDLTALQIMRHEMGHAAIAEGDISLDELREVMLSDFTAKELDRMALDYASALTTDGGELVMSIDEAFEEICCDALGKINIFENTERNTDSYEKAQDTVRKYAAERNSSKGRAPPEGGVKYSRVRRGRSIEIETMENNRFDRLRRFKDNLPDMWYAYTAKYLYVYENHSIMDYDIRHRISLSSSNDLANKVIKEISDGTFRTPEAFDTWFDSLQPRTRRHNSSLNDTKHGRKAVGSGEISQNSSPQSSGSAGSVQGNSNNSRVKNKFSMEAPVEQKENLIALHNLDETKLLKTLKLGGFPMPSIAITKSSIPHTNFGNITIVFGKETIDPKFDKRNTVYSADAWTPLFPRIEYEANEKAASKIRNRYYALSSKFGYELTKPMYASANYVDDVLTKYGGEEGIVEHFADDTEMMNVFLADTGKEPVKPIQSETVTRLSDEQIKEYDTFIKVLGKDTLNEMTAKANQSPLSARKQWLEKHGEELKSAFEQYLIETGMDETTAKEVTAEMRPAALLPEVVRARNYLKNGAETRTVSTDTKATREAIRSAVNAKEYKAWLKDLYSGIVKDSGVYNNKDYYTPSGNRRSFKATHFPGTLEGIVKAMASQGEGDSRNVMGFHGVKSLRAGTAERFKSIEDMHKLEGRLKHLTPEEANEISEALDSRLSELMHSIYELVPHSSYSNELIELDALGEIFMEAARLKYISPANVKALFKKYNYPLTDKMANDAVALLFDINNMPVNIFEAKPERAVGFDEIRNVIIPDTASDELRTALRDAGIENVEEYTAGDDAARMRIANEVPDVHFSREPETLNELRRQNKQLRERLEYWKGQTKPTTVRTVRKSDVQRLAREVIDMSDTDLKPNDITERLNELGRYILNEPELRYTDVAEMANDIASDVVENATAIVNEEDTAINKELRNYLKRVKLRNDGSPEFESIRSSYKRRIMFDKNGLGVDTAYAELNEMFGEGYFPEDIINPADQLERIAEVLDNTAPRYANPNGYYATEATEFLRNYIIDSMLSDQVRQTNPTYADKADAKLAKTKADYAQRMKEQRDKYNEKAANIREQNKQRVKDAIAKERKRGERRLQRFRDSVERRDARRQETAARSRYKAQIEKNIKTLSDWLLKPDHKNALKHIPGELQSTVRDFIASIDFTSARQLRGGKATAKDMRYINELERLHRYITDSNVGEDRYSGYLDLPPNFETELSNFIHEVNALARKNPDGYTVNDMNSAQLRELSDIIKTMKKTITDMNRMYQNQTFQHAYDAGASDVATLKGYIKTKAFTSNLAANRLDQTVMWEQSRPAHVFKRFGKGGESIYQEFADGQGTMAFLTKEVLDFASETYDSKEVKEWAKETHTFEFGSDEVTLTTAQLMSLYELNKRAQAKQHISAGGFRVANFKNGRFKMKADNGAHVFAEADLQSMFSELTDRQKEVADKLQRFMVERGGEWGNYVSVKRFDVEMFKDENYFPIKVDNGQIDAKETESVDNASLYQLLNMGFAKDVSAKANQAIVVYDIFDVFANHMAEMAQYRSFALPVLDAMKWFNYKERNENGVVTASFREEMRRAFGSDINGRGFAEKFITGVIKAYNGAEGRGDNSVNSRMLNRVNRAAVAYNTRVMIQQPSAIVRAAMYLDARDLAASLKNYVGITTKKNITEMHKYSGIAVWKDLGFYDVNVSRGVQELIKNNQGIIRRINEVGMKGAEFADRVTWAALWDASKKKIRRDTGLSESDAEFFPKVVKLFEDTIYNTQVVDTVLTKSAFSRDKSFSRRLFSSFMSEPMTTASLVTNEIFDIQMKQAAGQKLRPSDYSRLGKTVVVVAVAAVVNSMLASLADAWRDDDDYGTLGEKWLRALRVKLADELNPLTYLPYGSVVWDAFKTILDSTEQKWFGLDVYGNGTDLPLSDIIDATEKVLNIFQEINEKGELSKYTMFGGFYKTVNIISKITGVPVYNLMREGVSLYNNILPDSKLRSYEPTPKSAVQFAWRDGYLTDEEAITALQDEEAMGSDALDEGAAWLEVEKWKTGASSNYTKLYDALDNDGDIKSAVDELTEHGVEEKNIKSAVTRKYKDAYINGDNAERERIRRAMYATGLYGSVNEVIKKCNSWLEKTK